jgi:hypothetical protein
VEGQEEGEELKAYAGLLVVGLTLGYSGTFFCAARSSDRVGMLDGMA